MNTRTFSYMEALSLVYSGNLLAATPVLNQDGERMTCWLIGTLTEDAAELAYSPDDTVRAAQAIEVLGSLRDQARQRGLAPA